MVFMLYFIKLVSGHANVHKINKIDLIVEWNSNGIFQNKNIISEVTF